MEKPGIPRYQPVSLAPNILYHTTSAAIKGLRLQIFWGWPWDDDGAEALLRRSFDMHFP